MSNELWRRYPAHRWCRDRVELLEHRPSEPIIAKHAFVEAPRFAAARDR
jgi:hypothetical protein